MSPGLGCTPLGGPGARGRGHGPVQLASCCAPAAARLGVIHVAGRVRAGGGARPQLPGAVVGACRNLGGVPRGGAPSAASSGTRALRPGRASRAAAGAPWILIFVLPGPAPLFRLALLPLGRLLRRRRWARLVAHKGSVGGTSRAPLPAPTPPPATLAHLSSGWLGNAFKLDASLRSI